MIEHLVTPNEKIILELDRHEIEFLAAAAHLFLSHHPENTTVKALIQSLVIQTSYVHSDPQKHGISRPPLSSMLTTQQQWGSLAMGMDLSQLDHLLYTE